MNWELFQIPEPTLGFWYDQALTDPRDGLSIFGPCDSDTESHPRNVSYGAIGTQLGLDLLQGFTQRVQREIVSGSDDSSRRLWVPFPGFEVAFQSKLPEIPTRKATLDAKYITTLSMDL